MYGMILALSLLGQQQEKPQQHLPVYHFRTWPIPPGQIVRLRAPAPPSPMTSRKRDDPYGFTHWLNDTRLLYGLGPVTYDRNLEQWAAWNNAAQRKRGIGHYVRGDGWRQNAAVITGEISDYVGFLWMDSDEHWQTLLDPTITRIGLAWDGKFYWTFNAR